MFISYVEDRLLSFLFLAQHQYILFLLNSTEYNESDSTHFYCIHYIPIKSFYFKEEMNHAFAWLLLCIANFRKIVDLSDLIKIIMENTFILSHSMHIERTLRIFNFSYGRRCINLLQAQWTQPTYFSGSKQPDSMHNHLQCSSLILKIKFKK